MAYELVGKIKLFKEIRVVSEKFKVREFVVTVVDGAYSQDILLQASNEKIDALNVFPMGADVKVTFNLRGREWINPQGEAKYFNSLDAWKIEAAAPQGQPQGMPQGQYQGMPQNQGAPQGMPIDQIPVNPNYDSSGDDDLPF